MRGVEGSFCGLVHDVQFIYIWGVVAKGSLMISVFALALFGGTIQIEGYDSARGQFI